MGTFAESGVRKLMGDDQRPFWQQLQRCSVSFGGDVGSGLRVCGLGERSCTCGLGTDSTLGSREFPGRPVVRTPRFHCQGPGSIPGWGTLQAVWNGQKKKVLVAQSCPTLCNPMDCSSPGSCVREIFQARILEWVAISFSKQFSF